MEFNKSTGGGGVWLDKKALKGGERAKIVSEAREEESVYEGKTRKQIIAKVSVEGVEEAGNVALNGATKNALIDAFGTDSKDWINKVVKTLIEKPIINGKRVTALYLIPEGFEMTEDDAGYVVIQRPATSQPQAKESYPENEINPSDIPF